MTSWQLSSAGPTPRDITIFCLFYVQWGEWGRVVFQEVRRQTPEADQDPSRNQWWGSPEEEPKNTAGRRNRMIWHQEGGATHRCSTWGLGHQQDGAEAQEGIVNQTRLEEKGNLQKTQNPDNSHEPTLLHHVIKLHLNWLTSCVKCVRGCGSIS